MSRSNLLSEAKQCIFIFPPPYRFLGFFLLVQESQEKTANRETATKTAASVGLARSLKKSEIPKIPTLDHKLNQDVKHTQTHTLD